MNISSQIHRNEDSGDSEEKHNKQGISFHVT